MKTKKVIFLIITLCGSIYVRLVLSNFLILPLIKVGVTFENSHINSSLCFRHSSNYSSCLIIFISSTILSFGWFYIVFRQQKNQPDFVFWLIFVSILFNLVRTETSLERMAGIEPALSGRKHDILPLNYTRISTLFDLILRHFCTVPKCLIFGGDEESRTPVHNTFHIDFYKFSLSFLFVLFSPTNRLK